MTALNRWPSDRFIIRRKRGPYVDFFEGVRWTDEQKEAWIYGWKTEALRAVRYHGLANVEIVRDPWTADETIVCTIGKKPILTWRDYK